MSVSRESGYTTKEVGHFHQSKNRLNVDEVSQALSATRFAKRGLPSNGNIVCMLDSDYSHYNYS